MSELPAKVRRAALEALGRDTLARLTSKFDVTVENRRSAAAHVDALMRSRTVDFASLLVELQRDDLKAICEAMSLDSSGREKEVLVQRILAGPVGAPPPTTGNGAGTAEAAEPVPGGKLTIDQLEAYLWGAADKLRGKIDSSDYKSFIFGFLFLKRLSDVFEEEAEKLIASGTAPEVAWEDRDYHRFYVPKRARWSSIQKQATGIGDYLNKACAALEEENSSLEGVLRGIDYNDENKLGHAKERDDLLARLVHHFSKVSLRNADLAEPDMLGRAYEYLIERFADDAGKKGGEFYTPRKVVQLIVELLQPKEADRICDPTVGSGGMLIECAKYVEKHGGDPRKLTLHGQENNLGTWAICKMNMLLHGLPDARIEKGDTIRNPRLVKDGALEVYDKVIANPPFSLDDWGREMAESDHFGRFRFGTPPRGAGDLAFVQHMAATINLNGRVGVVMPHGVLFRSGSESDIREGMLREDLVEAVIGLPPNLFYGTGISAAIILLAKRKPESKRGAVLVIDASTDYLEGSAQNYLRDQDVARIASACRKWQDEAGYAHVATMEEIERNGWDLSIARYISTHRPKTDTSIATAIERVNKVQQQLDATLTEMRDLVTRLKFND